MRLRLNTTLRAALIAAVVSVTSTAYSGNIGETVTPYTQPQYGGTEHKWTGAAGTTDSRTDGNWTNGKPARTTTDGPVLVFDGADVMLTNVDGGVNTSDRGGIKVTNNSIVTANSLLGQWAGSVYVEKGSVLTTSYSNQLKNTESTAAANIYIDGTLNLTGSNNLNFNDGNDYQNWHIGEEGIINITNSNGNVTKGSKTWNLEFVVNDTAKSYAKEIIGREKSDAALQTKTVLTCSNAIALSNVNTYRVINTDNKLLGDETTTGQEKAAKLRLDGKNWVVDYFVEGYTAATLTWNGGNNGVWEDLDTGWTLNDNAATFISDNDDSVVFGSAGSKEVAINSAIVVKDVTVRDSGYAFNISSDGSLTAKSLTMEEGATLSMAGGTTSVSGAVTIVAEGALKVASDATLKVTNENTAKALMKGNKVDNKGTFELGADVTFDSTTTTTMAGKLAVAAGKKLTLGTSTNQAINFASFDALVLKQGANIDTKAQSVAIKNLTANNSTITISDAPGQTGGIPTGNSVDLQGTTTLAGNLTIDSGWKYRINIAELTGAGDLKLTGGNEQHHAIIGNASNRSINVTNKMNSVEFTGSVNLTGALTVNGATSATGSGTMTVGGLVGSAALNVTNGVTFNVAQGGNYSYTGTMTVGGPITKTGEGTQAISGLNLHTALEVQAGTLVLNGVTQTTGASITVGATGTLTLGGTVTFVANKAISVTQGGTVNWDSAVVFNLDGLQAQELSGKHVYTLFSGADVNLSTLTIDNITMTGGAIGKNWEFGTNGTISYTSVAANVWTDDSGNGRWNYVDANWSKGVFAPNDVARFEGAGIDVMINAAVEAGGIQIADGASVALSEDWFEEGSLSSPSLEIGEGATLNMLISIGGIQQYSLGEEATWVVAADQTLAAGTGTNDGTIQVVDTATLTISGTATADDWAGIKNGGTVVVDLGGAEAKINMNAASTGTLDVNNGTVDYRSALGAQTLKLGNGTKLLFGNNDGTTDAPEFTNDIVLGGNATIQVWGSSKHSAVTISGDVTGAGYTLTKEDGNQNLTFSGKVNIGGLTTAANGNGTIIFNGGEGSLGTITTKGTSTIKFSAKDGAKNEYTFDSFAMSPDSSDATRWLVVDSGVTVHGTGSSVGDSSTIHSGWGVKSGGLEVNGVLTTDSTIGLEANNQTAYIKGSGIINTAGLNLCNGSTTYIQDGITINITSDKGIYARNTSAAAGSIHLKKATLQATTADWEFKVGRAEDPVTLEDSTDGTTFDAAAERTITISKALGGDGKLVKAGEGTVILKAANSYAGGTDIKAGTVKASNDSALGSAGTVTIAEGAALEVDAALNLGDRLQSSGSITVNEGKSLTLAEGSSIYETITNAGTVNLTAVTLGDGFEEKGGGDGYFDVAGNKLADDTANHYVGTNESYVQVVNNAQGATSTGTAVWKEQTISLETDGRIVTGEGSPTYDTFYIVADSENISDIAKNPTTAIEVSAGALVIDAATTGIDITVTDEGTITGEHADATQIGIAKEGWAHYTKPVETSGVKFTAAQDDDVLIVNNGETTQKYTVADRNMAVAAQTLEMTKDDGNVTVSNAVYVDEIVNTTGKVLTLNNVEEVVELTNMNITGSTAELSYVYGEQQVAEATVSISGVLKGGEATLLANLTLVGGSTLDVDGGAGKALTLGSTLTFDFTDGGLVNLDEDTIAALNALEVGQSLDLIKALQGTPLAYDGAAAGAQWYGDLFYRADGLLGDYQVYAQGDAFGLTKVSNVPEPTTGTLSLLALAALAARRRRK